MKNYKNLFLQQSYQDNTEHFTKILKDDTLPFWDYIILSASNEAQAEGYMHQMQVRLDSGALPKNCTYAAVPDPNGERVGSGGSTFAVLKFVRDNELKISGIDVDSENNNSTDVEDFNFSGLKILLLHSGGDAKRTPQYSACGKIFSPVPRVLPNGARSTLFDEFVIGCCGIPARIKDGMLTCSGDVILLFNSLQLDFYGEGAAALSIKSPVEIGKNHGVFLGGSDGNVQSFLHKQTVETLTEKGAVDARGNIDIDTGSVIFSGKLLNDLYSLVKTKESFAEMVNSHVRLSFYADFLYPLASGGSLEAFYSEQPEGDFSEELKIARTKLWEKLHKYSMKLVRFSPASFLHFGTTKELLALVTENIEDYSYLNWKGAINSAADGSIGGSKKVAVSNSYVSSRAEIGEGSYIEDSFIDEGTSIGKGCVISCVTLKGVKVPDGVCLHGLKLLDGKFVVRAYGVKDNPKEKSIFGVNLEEALWDVKLFAAKDTIAEAAESTMRLVNMLCGNENGSGNADIESFVKEDNYSLKTSFNYAKAADIIDWQAKLLDRVRAEEILYYINNRIPVEKLIEEGMKVPGRVKKLLLEEISEGAEGEFVKVEVKQSELDKFSKNIRIYYYLYKLTGDEKMLDKCFGEISRTISGEALKGVSLRDDLKIAKEEAVVKLPVRVNFGGGWSDTPPYCMEHGGTVLNAAITLDGELPIEVTVKKLSENKIELASTDIGSYREFTTDGDFADLLSCTDPSDTYALHKAALISCGIIPAGKVLVKEENRSGGKLIPELCKKIGGGFYINTRVINIPKGSGLGTSSILAGAAVKAIFEFFGIKCSDSEVFERVLCLEQLMSTGGGWQDQVGGIAPGIKLVTAPLGIKQEITCTPVKMTEQALKELDDRFAVIYTGQRRLARNLLRDVVGKYIGGNETSTEVLYKIQQVAVLMKFELEKGNVDGFARLMSEHWELSKKLDGGSTNTAIDQIFVTIEDLIDGKMICGAGGGGFLQILLKKGVTVADLQKRIDEVFEDSGVRVYETTFC